MRKFSSYGPLDINLHYYAPREALIERVSQQLIGDHPRGQWTLFHGLGNIIHNFHSC